eukprot:gene19159-19533_t
MPDANHHISGLAFDKASVRTTDVEGRLHVAVTNISKATVNPYLGREIPEHQALGLDPDRIYKLLRDPKELEQAALSFNNLPLLSKHVPVSAADHQPDAVIGSTGTDAEFVAPYLRNSLVVWAKAAIKAIEDETQKELSCAYRYRADMTPGTFEGEAYDGVMRDLVGNHVALVKEGRAGPDVVVGDSTEGLSPMKLSRKAALLQGASLAYLAPKLASDAKLDLGSVFAGITTKNFKAKKPAIVADVTKKVAGKLAQDADLADFAKLLDSLEDVEPAEDAETVEEPAVKTTPEKVAMSDKDKALDADPIAKVKDFLKGKISADDLAKIDEICGAGKAEDDIADGDDDEGMTSMDKGAKDEEKKDMVTKPAMDAAIAAAVKVAQDAASKNQREIREAERAVRPYVGELAIACDSAAGVYSAALKVLGVKVEGVHPSAYPAILAAQPIPGSKPKVTKIAQDSAQAKSFAERYPDASRIRCL